jgi:hypothetical protein
LSSVHRAWQKVWESDDQERDSECGREQCARSPRSRMEIVHDDRSRW